MTSRLSPEALRLKASVFERAAAQKPDKAKELLGAAKAAQLAADVAENGLAPKPQPMGSRIELPANDQ